MAISTNSSAIKNIQATISGMKSDVAQTKTSVTNIRKVIAARTKVKSEAVFKSKALYQKRLDASRRKDAEDQLEVSNISPSLSPTLAVRSSGKGFVGRIISAIGYMAAGWILNQLPVWTQMAQEFIARTYRLVDLSKDFVNASFSFIKSFPRIVEAYAKNIISFDFFDTSGRVTKAFDELNASMESMQGSVDEALKLFTTPLTEQIDDAERVGESGYTDSGPSSYAAGTIPEKVKQDTAFTQGVTDLAKKLNVPEDYLYAVMGFETGGTFSPSAQNPKSKATGLIQFMPETAEGLGTSTQALSGMSRAEQLKYVEKFLSNKGIQGGSLSDVYMAVLFPAAVGKPEDFVLFGKGAMKGFTGIAYEQNAGLDLNKDGSVTKAEAASKVKDYLPKQGSRTSASQAQVNMTGGVSGSKLLLSAAQGGHSEVGATDRFGYSSWRGRHHNGIDIGTSKQKGYFVSFLKDGKISLLPNNGAAGNEAVIMSEGIKHRFLHLARFMTGAGNYKAGTVIGEIGTTGRSTSEHLHYEVHPSGTTGVNPEPYLHLISIGKDLKNAGRVSSTASPAKVTPTTVSEKINVIDTRPQPTPEKPSSGGAAQQIMSTVSSAGNMLNNFIRQKFLTDLSYL